MSVASIANDMLHQKVQPSESSQDLLIENKLLFDQLHVVQAELERRYSEGQTSIEPGSQPIVIKVTPVDSHLIEVQAENLRYQALINAQRDIRCGYVLATQLGRVLINGTRSAGAFFSLPIRLYNVWREHRPQRPFSSLGGKNFDKVISAYKQGGEQAVESLLNEPSISTVTRANAWTALARTLQYIDPDSVALMAKRAFMLEPRAFRQKWLAFRLHESGDFLEAEAMLDLLPEDTQLSDSETRQAKRLKAEALQYRLDTASSMLVSSEERNEFQRQWQGLAQSRDALAAEVEKQRTLLIAAHSRELSDKQVLDQQASELRQLHAERESLQTQLSNQLNKKNMLSMLLEKERKHSQTINAELLDVKKRYSEQKILISDWFDQCVVLQVGIAELIQKRNQNYGCVEQLNGQSEDLQENFINKEHAAKSENKSKGELYEILRTESIEIASRCAELFELTEQRLSLCDLLCEKINKLKYEHDKQEVEALNRLEFCELLRARLADGVAKGGVDLEASKILSQDLNNLIQNHNQEIRATEKYLLQCKSLCGDLDFLRSEHAEKAALVEQHLLQQSAFYEDLVNGESCQLSQVNLETQHQGEIILQAKEQLCLALSKMAAVDAKQQELESLLTVQIRRVEDLLQILNDLGDGTELPEFQTN